MKKLILFVLLAGTMHGSPDSLTVNDPVERYREYFRHTLVFSDLYGENGEFRIGGKVPTWHMMKTSLEKEAPEKLRYARYRTLAMIPAIGLIGSSLYFLFKDDPGAVDRDVFTNNYLIAIGLETAAWGLVRFMHKMELLSRHAYDQAMRERYLGPVADTVNSPARVRSLSQWDRMRPKYTTCYGKPVTINGVPVGGWSAGEELAACKGISVEAGHYFEKAILYKKLAAGGFTVGIGTFAAAGIARVDEPLTVLTVLGGGLGAALIGKTWLGFYHKYKDRALKVYDRDLRDKLEVGYPELVKKK